MSKLIHKSDYRKTPVFKSIWAWMKFLQEEKNIPEYYTIEEIGEQRSLVLFGMIIGTIATCIVIFLIVGSMYLAGDVSITLT